MKIGETRGANQFLSTSLSTGGSFTGKYKIVVMAPKGTNAGYIESIASKEFKSQREMLFDKDVQYELIYSKNNVVVVRAVP